MSQLDIHAERCVHQRVVAAACDACVRACPRGAWHMNDAGLAFDADACDACGLCVAACPTQALALPAPTPLLRPAADGRLAAWWRCERAGLPGPASAPCLLALSPAWLHGASTPLGVREHVFAPGACSRCERGASLAEWQRQWQALGTRRALALRVVSAQEWPTDGPAPDPGRRRFLARAPTPAAPTLTSAREDVLGHSAGPAANRPPAPPPAPVWTVDFNRERCTLCLACARICPTGAINFAAACADPESASFGFDLEKCTGCGLCTAACDAQALSQPQPAPLPDGAPAAHPPPAAPPTHWPARRVRCARCRIDFHQFTEPAIARHSATLTALCPTCMQGRPPGHGRIVQTDAMP